MLTSFLIPELNVREDAGVIFTYYAFYHDERKILFIIHVVMPLSPEYLHVCNRIAEFMTNSKFNTTCRLRLRVQVSTLFCEVVPRI